MKYQTYEQWNKAEIARHAESDLLIECPSCHGEGDAECPCCYHVEECADCDGSGKIKYSELRNITAASYQFPRVEYFNAVTAMIKKLCEWDRSRDFFDELGVFFREHSRY